MSRKLVAITGALLGACTLARTASYNLGNGSGNFRVMA